ncbi:MAG: hypothetical protein ACT4PW_14295 [Acidimicrobiia bacterium]
MSGVLFIKEWLDSVRDIPGSVVGSFIPKLTYPLVGLAAFFVAYYCIAAIAFPRRPGPPFSLYGTLIYTILAGIYLLTLHRGSLFSFSWETYNASGKRPGGEIVETWSSAHSAIGGCLIGATVLCIVWLVVGNGEEEWPNFNPDKYPNKLRAT